MAVDLFALRMNLQTTGAGQAMAALKGVETQGVKTAAGLGGVSAGLGKFNAEAKATEAAGLAVSSRLGIMGTIMADLGPLALGAGAGFLVLAGLINATAPAADRLQIANLRLEGASKLTGTSLAFLQSVSSRVQSDFRLNATQANELTAELSKLANKAGDVGKTGPALRAFLDIGAAQGMTASQTLIAVHQAILGIDEGTDKLFQKNPSVIYKEFAASIGTTAGKLTDQQKAQALLNEAMVAGEKVRGSYAKFLETAPGATAALATATERFAASIGSLFNPMRTWLATTAAGFLNWLSDVADRFKRIDGIAPVSIAGMMTKLGVAIGTSGSGGTDWDAGDTGASRAGGQRNRGQGLVSLPKLDPVDQKDLDRLAAKAAAAHVKRMLGILDISAPETLPGGGLMSTPAMFGSAAGDIAGLSNTIVDRGKRDPLDVWQQSLNQSAQGVKDNMRMLGTDLGMTLANGFSSAMTAAVQGKNPFKAFGQAILGGLGSIFTRMGAELMAYGVIMLNLLPFLSNPFTSGFAAIAAGAALVAVGTALGGIATGGGGGKGGGGSAPKDTVTQIHLTANGAGGFTAPKPSGGDHFTIIGANDPALHRQLAETVKNARRSGHRF